MSKTTPPQTDTARPAQGEQGRTDAAKPESADTLPPDTPEPDDGTADGGRISSADGRFVADHRPSR